MKKRLLLFVTAAIIATTAGAQTTGNYLYWDHIHNESEDEETIEVYDGDYPLSFTTDDVRTVQGLHRGDLIDITFRDGDTRALKIRKTDNGRLSQFLHKHPQPMEWLWDAPGLGALSNEQCGEIYRIVEWYLANSEWPHIRAAVDLKSNKNRLNYRIEDRDFNGVTHFLIAICDTPGEYPAAIRWLVVTRDLETVYEYDPDTQTLDEFHMHAVSPPDPPRRRETNYTAVEGGPVQDAPWFIAQFYEEYLIAADKFGREAAERVKRQYLTPALIDRIEAAGLDYDPLLDAKHAHVEYWRTLTTNPVEGRANTYRICYTGYPSVRLSCVTLSMTGKRDDWRIDGIDGLMPAGEKFRPLPRITDFSYDPDSVPSDEIEHIEPYYRDHSFVIVWEKGLPEEVYKQMDELYHALRGLYHVQLAQKQYAVFDLKDGTRIVVDVLAPQNGIQPAGLLYKQGELPIVVTIPTDSNDMELIAEYLKKR